VIFVASVGVGCVVSVLDLLFGPSLNLLSVNSTGIILVTLSCAAVIVFASPRDARRVRVPPSYRLRMPVREMYVVVRGARDGYVSSRRRVSRLFAGAVRAKLDTGRRAISDNEVDTYLREVLASSYSPELFPAEEGNPSRVPYSRTYVAQLREALSLVQRSLEGRR
jgi:hypothetical protein